MVFFITCLRALAACLITNSHYTGIYPSDLIANGGLIGDVLFFAVSGYCLYNVKASFPKWYVKRVWRIYPPVWIATLLYVLVGAYSFSDNSFLYWFVYPTYYHFIASIVLLYIPYYFIVKIRVLRDHIPLIMLLIGIVMLGLYVFAYNKTYYHIDNVREPFIRFLFMESMLMGAYFRKEEKFFRNNISVKYPILAILSFAAYFISKTVFSKITVLSDFQIVNQLIIFVLLYTVFRTGIGMDAKLDILPKSIKSCITFVAGLTLEIYVVQYVLIDVLRPFFGFPLNWCVITASIVLAAWGLHNICRGLYKFSDWIVLKILQKRKSV